MRWDLKNADGSTYGMARRREMATYEARYIFLLTVIENHARTYRRRTLCACDGWRPECASESSDAPAPLTARDLVIFF